jgi:hypothetical protein
MCTLGEHAEPGCAVDHREKKMSRLVNLCGVVLVASGMLGVARATEPGGWGDADKGVGEALSAEAAEKKFQSKMDDAVAAFRAQREKLEVRVDEHLRGKREVLRKVLELELEKTERQKNSEAAEKFRQAIWEIESGGSRIPIDVDPQTKRISLLWQFESPKAQAALIRYQNQYAQAFRDRCALQNKYRAALAQELHKAFVELESNLHTIRQTVDPAEAIRLRGIEKAARQKIDDQLLAGNDGWLVLFRSSNPKHWNTTSGGKTDADGYAIPVNWASDKINYLRLTRMDNGQSVVIPMTYEKLTGAYQAVSDTLGWHGLNEIRSNARHLGVYRTETVRLEKGEISISVSRGHKGWGFGHRAWIDDRQGYVWDGMALPKTVFEIAVAKKPLSVKG